MADNPEQGKQRRYRSFPYFMSPAGKHFAVYEPLEENIVIATVLHSKRDIETLVKKLGHELAEEIMQTRHQIEKNEI